MIIFRNMSSFSHVWDKLDYSVIILYLTIIPFYHMQRFSGIWDGLLFLHLINIFLSHYFFLLKCNSLSLLFFLSWNKIFYQLYLFPNRIFLRCSEKKITFNYIRNLPAALEGLYFFGLIICFISFPFYSLVSFLEFWESILLLCRRNMFYHFFCFRVIAFASLHIYYLTVFVLIMYLQCNIFICLRYRWRTIFLRLISMFFRIAFVSDTWEEPFYFVLRLCFSVFYLSQISEKIHITSP